MSMSASAHTAPSNGAPSHQPAGSARSPDRYSTPRGAAASAARALAISWADRSTPTTAAPRRASPRATRPCPHAASSTRSPSSRSGTSGVPLRDISPGSSPTQASYQSAIRS
jgi:hypothetical protein